MEDIEYCVLPAGKYSEAANLAAKALIDSPAYRDIFSPIKDAHTRVSILEYIFSCNIHMVGRQNPSFLKCGIDKKTQELVAFFILIPSNLSSFTLFEKIFGGLLYVPILAGWQVMSRMLQASDWIDENEANILKKLKEKLLLESNEDIPKTIYKLQRMVVRPDMQGKGIGSRLLRQGILELHAPVFLSTQEERNVNFYKKLNFEVVNEVRFSLSGEEEDNFSSWSMFRPVMMAESLSD